MWALMRMLGTFFFYRRGCWLFKLGHYSTLNGSDIGLDCVSVESQISCVLGQSDLYKS